MRKLFAAFAGIVLVLALADTAKGSQISWTAPTQYTDNTAIPSASRATITTRIYYGSTEALCQAASNIVPFATVTGGVSSWTGILPVTAKGTTTYYCATAEIPAEGRESVKSQAFAFFIQFVPPKAPTSVQVARVIVVPWRAPES